MNIQQINYSDSSGGAARAAYRIHSALINAGIKSSMLVSHNNIKNNLIYGPHNLFGRINSQINYRGRIGELSNRFMKTGNPILHSPSILSSNWSNKINMSDVDLVNLHWINHEMMSISDIAKITKPIVWTLHDMWAFCGAEHYSYDRRYIDGYYKNNRPEGDSGVDINRLTWKRKMKLWKSKINIVTPSSWLAECAKNSMLMGDWPITCINNPIDTEFWRPISKKLAREMLGLSMDKPVLLFGGSNGAQELHKGFDLLKESVGYLKQDNFQMQFLILGMSKPQNNELEDFQTKYTGKITDDLSLLLIYSAADALVIPSRLDNLPNMGVEGMSCGLPVIAFNACGLPDIVDHMHNGYLAKAFDSRDLSVGIKWVLQEQHKCITTSHKDINSLISLNARNSAINKFSYNVVSNKYISLYDGILINNR